MARYYFDVENGQGPQRDEFGVELPSADAIRLQVAQVLIDIARDELADEAELSIKIDMRDDADFVIFSGILKFEGVFRGL